MLPFANLLTDGEPLDYGAGIADVIRSKLVQVKKLHVVAKRSSDAVATEALDVAEIRRKLHVSQVLDGSIQRLGERVRVTAQLVDTGSARTVWSQVFDRDSGAIFAIQDEIVLAVADAMKAEKATSKTAEKSKAEEKAKDTTKEKSAVKENKRAADNKAEAKDDKKSSKN